MRSWIVGLALLAGCAAQAQQPAPEATPEQKARSYVASAFMTGAAPTILSDKVALGPELQARLGLPPGTDSAKIYDALIGLTQGATPKVGEPTPEEAQRSPQHSAPLFTLSAGDLKLLLHYDLQGNDVDFVEQLSAPPIAATTPVAEPAAPTPQEKTSASEEKAPEAEGPVYSVVEPKSPPEAKTKPQAQARPQPRVAQARTTPPREARLKANGPCVIKPVMTDQDLVNCGATPPRY